MADELKRLACNDGKTRRAMLSDWHTRAANNIEGVDGVCSVAIKLWLLAYGLCMTYRHA